jgi:hypothetical protein
VRVGREHVAALGVRLVLALGVQVEEHAGVGVEDRLDGDVCGVVVIVVLVLVHRAQAPGTVAAADRLLERVVVGFVRGAALLVGPVQAGAGVGEIVGRRAVLGLELRP